MAVLTVPAHRARPRVQCNSSAAALRWRPSLACNVLPHAARTHAPDVPHYLISYYYGMQELVIDPFATLLYDMQEVVCMCACKNWSHGSICYAAPRHARCGPMETEPWVEIKKSKRTSIFILFILVANSK